MKCIYKYQLDVIDIQVVEMPKGAQIISVQEQNGQPTMWAMVNTLEEMEKVTIRIYGTGHEIKPINYQYGVMHEYLGTVQIGAFVGHIFKQT